METQLTPRQTEILIYVRAYLHANGYAPTQREVGEYFNISSQRVGKYIFLFINAGLLAYNPRKGWRFVDLPERAA